MFNIVLQRRMKTKICPLALLSVQVFQVQSFSKRKVELKNSAANRTQTYCYIEASASVLPDLEKTQLFFFKTSPANQERLVHPQPKSKV